MSFSKVRNAHKTENTEDYLELINKVELKEILEKYGKDKKTIKRLCK